MLDAFNKLKFQSNDKVEINLTKPNISTSDIDKYEKLFSSRKIESDIFYSFQLLIGPLVESYLLLDRYMYLSENSQVKAFIKPVFNELHSPRNLALVAIKTKS